MMTTHLILVVYMWMAQDEFLYKIEQVVEKAWSRRTQQASFMDAMQVGVMIRFV